MTFWIVACRPDQFSFSPDGKTVAFIRQSDDSLWLWDSQNQSAKRVPTFDRQVGWCYYIPSGEMKGELLFATAHPPSDPSKEPDPHSCADLHQYNPATGSVVREKIDTEVFLYGGYSFSGDGHYFYYIAAREKEKTKKDEQIERLYELDLTKRHAPSKEIFMMDHGGFVCPCANATGSKILLTFDREIQILDKQKGKSRSLLKFGKNEPIHPIFPTWADGDKTILYLKYDDDAKGELAPLVSYSPENKASRPLAPNIYFMQKPALNADGKSLLVTMVKSGSGKISTKIDDAEPSAIQVALIEIATGKITYLTDEPQGAGNAMFDPTGKKIAYLSPILGKKGSAPKILDLETKKKIAIPE